MPLAAFAGLAMVQAPIGVKAHGLEAIMSAWPPGVGSGPFAASPGGPNPPSTAGVNSSARGARITGPASGTRRPRAPSRWFERGGAHYRAGGAPSVAQPSIQQLPGMSSRPGSPMRTPAAHRHGSAALDEKPRSRIPARWCCSS